MNEIPERLAAVRARIERAALAAGRDARTVTLLAVSKTKPVDDILAALAAGQTAFGENYLQEALAKIDALRGRGICWHFIGRLQGNKAGEISRHFDWVHSLASSRHAELLNRHRPDTLTPLQVCIQVNLSGEATKGGIAPGQLSELASLVKGLPRLKLRGLMTMPDPQAGAIRQHEDFARLRGMLSALDEQRQPVDTLSMGMSADMEAAISEGATIVRVGTDIFGARDR